MRLLRIETLELETFVNASTTPPYAILSHTWHPGEVTLQDLDLTREALASRRGWQKITRFRNGRCSRADWPHTRSSHRTVDLTRPPNSRGCESGTSWRAGQPRLG